MNLKMAGPSINVGSCFWYAAVAACLQTLQQCSLVHNALRPLHQYTATPLVPSAGPRPSRSRLCLRGGSSSPLCRFLSLSLSPSR